MPETETVDGPDKRPIDIARTFEPTVRFSKRLAKAYN